MSIFDRACVGTLSKISAYADEIFEDRMDCFRVLRPIGAL